jgi:hypothetical protein
MKYIKKFLEITLYRDINIELQKKSTTVMFGGKPCLVIYYDFELADYSFSCKFMRTQTPIPHWYCYWGYYDSEGELIDKELNLSYTNTLNLMQVISNIIIKFTIERKDVIVMDHRDMYNETNVPKDKLNKRAKILYQYIKDRIPEGYTLSYWYNNTFQNSEDTASTACIIYKQNIDISALVDNRLKIEI